MEGVAGMMRSLKVSEEERKGGQNPVGGEGEGKGGGVPGSWKGGFGEAGTS